MIDMGNNTKVTDILHFCSVSFLTTKTLSSLRSTESINFSVQLIGLRALSGLFLKGHKYSKLLEMKGVKKMNIPLIDVIFTLSNLTTFRFCLLIPLK